MNLQIWNTLTSDEAFTRTVDSINADNLNNIFLSGAVPATRRGAALALCEELVRRNGLCFSGTATHFSLTLPALTTPAEASASLERLMQCVSIGAGYYSCFRGVVILEFAGETDPGCCAELRRYLRCNQDSICFILYSAGDKRQSDALWQTFGSFRQWQQIDLGKPSREALCSLFLALAREHGLTLTAGAKAALEELAAQSDLENADLVGLAESMVSELVMPHRNYPVRASQIRKIALPVPSTQRRSIGFGVR